MYAPPKETIVLIGTLSSLVLVLFIDRVFVEKRRALLGRVQDQTSLGLEKNSLH